MQPRAIKCNGHHFVCLFVGVLEIQMCQVVETLVFDVCLSVLACEARNMVML